MELAGSEPSYNLRVVQLIQEVGALWLLPSAFCWLSVEFTELGRSIFHGVVHNGFPVDLSIEDQDAFVQGHSFQSQRATNFYCIRSTFLVEIWSTVSRFPLNPLGIWDADDRLWFEAVCPRCPAVLKESHEAARQAFWDKLPEIYWLPPWEELEKMRIPAIGTNWFDQGSEPDFIEDCRYSRI
ncbi:hypothetical protein DFH07DRAFT_941301 [Mycena maculata]|uniref:Uncharacterized protein n=1 Tax=Mycena maculata TaxID=230809 RepID=A0AAD7J0V3_9AGAR|nr:hypothetical protein DFH07DRAFT_941301 [Mycena maculata]